MGDRMIRVSEAYIAPWVLPNEDIPLHVTWPKSGQFDRVHVTISEDLKVVDVLNVDEVKVEDNIITVKPRKTVAGTPNYFGIILRASKIYEELKVAKKIIIEFLHENAIVSHHELYARIFRPYLEIVRAPKRIELLDEERTRTLPLYLRYVGFGDVQMKIEARIGGRIVSYGESIIYELLRRLMLSGLFEEPSTREEEDVKGRKKELWISPDYVREMAEKLQESIETGTIPVEEIDPEAIEEIRRWLSEMRTQEKLSEVLYSRVEDILLGLLVDLLDRHPTDNVKLSDARTMIRTKIQAPIENVTMRLRYRDLMENEYPSVEVPIKIVDRRVKETGVLINIPIVIEKWKYEPFMNVKDMKIVEE